MYCTLYCRDGIRPAPDYAKVSYSEIRESLQTGDIILFSGATSSGAIIKIFDGAIFSHVGLVSIIIVIYTLHAVCYQ